MHEAHKGLLKGVRNGNLASVTKYYELTGRHDPNKEAQIDVRRVLHTFIEIIQKYVQDPVLLHQIAMELSNAASAESYTTGLTNQMMSGAQQYSQQTVRGNTVPSLPAPRSLEGFDDE